MDASKTGFLKEIFIFACIVLFVVIPIRTYVAQPFIVRGDSMFPTFHSGDYLIIDQLSYRFGTPQRYDIVIMRWPKDPDIFFIKRVIGLPGETIEFNGDQVSVSSGASSTPTVVDQSFLRSKPRTEYGSHTLGPDEYFVMGDNRDNSSDSRTWGPLPRNDIVGRAVLRLFPFTSIDYLPGFFTTH